MNKYLTFPGQQPVYLGDIDFLQESVRSAFLMLLKGLTGLEKPNCILRKATSEADGVICLDGEIMPYKAASSSGMIGGYTYNVVSTYDGSRVFKNGENHSCYETRYAQETVVVGGQNIASLDELLFARITAKQRFENTSNNTIRRVTRYTILGNSITVENTFEILADATVEYLCKSEGMSIVNTSVISQAPIYCSFIAESNGAMISLPAKITFEASTSYVGAVDMTIKINQTKFSAGTKGVLCFSVVLQTY